MTGDGPDKAHHSGSKAGEGNILSLEELTMMRERSDAGQYLITTPMCDYNHPLVQETVHRVVAGAQTERDEAVQIFHYVRDTIRFSIAFSKSKASQILKQGYGECITKTNVQVAFLRAVGIPARMRWVLAQAKVLTSLVAPFMLQSMKTEASHFWAECYLAGRWISCEAMLDKPLYEGMLKQGLITKDQIPSIDWDGENDLKILTPWITSDRGVVSSADDAVKAYQNNGEGAPPVWIERLMAPVFLPYNLRFSDRIRRLAKT
jgi:transglutaminase-like putative cysteine protease